MVARPGRRKKQIRPIQHIQPQKEDPTDRRGSQAASSEVKTHESSFKSKSGNREMRARKKEEKTAEAGNSKEIGKGHHKERRGIERRRF